MICIAHNKIGIVHNWLIVIFRIDIPEHEMKRRRHDETAPYRTPTFVGCAFAMDREFFFELGSYDEGMDIWGSENMEISLRVIEPIFPKKV